MKITFSSISHKDSCTAFTISFGGDKQDGQFFKIVSYSGKGTSPYTISRNTEAIIEDNTLHLDLHDERLPTKLSIGNKCLNQLRLALLGHSIPDTVALDFMFSNEFENTRDIDLKSVYKQLVEKELGPLIAIRCSSNLEDGARQSFAGVFDTYLNVPNKYIEFKKRIHRSYRRFYPRSGKQDMQAYDVKLGIMVQNMIKPKYSGFLFTSSPINPPSSWMKIEYWHGDRESSESSSITLNKETGRRVSGVENDRDALSVEMRDKLFKSARKLEQQFGFPQDAEFVISGEDRLFFVQTRPITAFSYSPVKIRQKEQSRLMELLDKNIGLYKKEPILSSTNISELFVRAIPLGYSIFKYGFAGTENEEGGISAGRARLGYARLDFEDQVNFFHTVADQARTNLIVDALTFRLPGVEKKQYLDTFVDQYLTKILEEKRLALYPEDGLYLQNDDLASWQEIIKDHAESYYKEYKNFLSRLIDYHALKEHENAGTFFTKNEEFYRTYLNSDRYAMSKTELIKQIDEMMTYLRTEFCPQYVIFARLGFLCTHVSKNKIKDLELTAIDISPTQILNELVCSFPLDESLDTPNYPHFERLLLTGKVTLSEFLNRFQHIGSLDINQPRLGEYPISTLNEIFGLNKTYEHGDGRLIEVEKGIELSPKIAALQLDENVEFWKWCVASSRFMRLRERAKFELLKILYILKLSLKELARYHSLGDLIYYLDYEDIMTLSENNTDNLRFVALRQKAYFEACRDLHVKDVVTKLRITPFQDKTVDTRRAPEKGYHFIKGQSIFYGDAEGVCLTAQNNEEYVKKLARFRADKIENIIGVFKSVELSYFNLGALQGFTTENDGYLSHAATIAREFRIPHITGIRMDQFQDGDNVMLDTENEQVRLRRFTG